MTEEWTIRKILDWSKSYLRQAGIESARFEAETLLAHALSAERLEVYLTPNRVLSDAQRRRFRQLLIKRKSGQPLQYLLGEVDFLGHALKVSPHVLIPRPETEGLVALVLRDPALQQIRHGLDLGTGSGAIAIALAAQMPLATITAVDISARALALARENALRNHVADRIRFLQSDWFSSVQGTFDVIVSNPPYVAAEEVCQLPEEVQREPRIALDGGARGIEAIERIAISAQTYLRDGGRIYLEFGAEQGDLVRGLLQRAGYDRIDIYKDFAGHERYGRAVKR